MGWFEDATAWVNTAVSDVVDFVEDTAEDVGDFFEDAGTAIGSAADDVGEAAGQAAAAVAQAASAAAQTVATAAAAVVDRVGDVVEVVVDRVGDAVDRVGDVVEVVVDRVGDAAESAVNWMEDAFANAGGAVDSLFTGPSTASSIETGGLIRTDWDDSLQVEVFDDVDGDGINDYYRDSPSSEWAGDGGLIGVDWAPAPYVEGHLDVSADGGISIGGVLQGTMAPSDVIDDVFARNADGSWGSSESEEFSVDLGDIPPTDLAGSIYVKYSPPELIDLDVSAVGVLDVQQQKDIGFLQQELVEEAATPPSLDWKDDTSSLDDLGLGVSEQMSPISSDAGQGDLIFLDESAGDMAPLDLSPMVVVDVVLLDDFTVALSGTEAVEAEVDSMWDDIG